MMELYRAEPDYDGWPERNRYTLRAERAWMLPGTHCDTCETSWATTGLQYPLLSLAAFPREEEYQQARNIPLAEYARLRDRLASWLDPVPFLLPGAEFGPLVGRSSGAYGDFSWLYPWTPLISQGALDRLRGAGIVDLRATATLLRARATKRVPALRELQIAPRAFIAPSAYATPPTFCPVCRRVGGTIAEWKVRAVALPTDASLFRLYEAPTAIIATAAFVAAARALDLGGIRFTPVPVVDEPSAGFDPDTV